MTVNAVRTDPSKPKLKVVLLDAQAFTPPLELLCEAMERKASEIYGPWYSTSWGGFFWATGISLTVTSTACDLLLPVRFTFLFHIHPP